MLSSWGDEENGQNGTATGAQWALGGDTVGEMRLHTICTVNSEQCTVYISVGNI